MNRTVTWVWKRGVVSTFMAGLFLILPIVITLALMGWLAAKLRAGLGPESLIGRALTSVGLHLVTNKTVATAIGWVLVLAGVWLLGLLAKWVAKDRLTRLIDTLMNRVPLIRSIYGPVSQVVGMLKKDEKTDVRGMPVVFCTLGEHYGGGFLGLLASAETYHFAGRECQAVYVPTSPVPMSGGILFVPAGQVRKVDMSVDDLMKVYFSLGVLSPQVVPERYRGVLVAPDEGRAVGPAESR